MQSSKFKHGTQLFEMNHLLTTAHIRRGFITGEIPDAVKDVVAAVNASKARIAEMEAEKASKSAAPANEQTKEEENAVSVKVCPVCGAASEDKFCPHCGAPMGE